MENKLPQRKPLRLKRIDYNNVGAYYITLCAEGKANIFSNILITDDGAKIRLTQKGKIIEEIINDLPPHLGVDVDKYVIMPNHIHIILIVNPNQTIGTRSAISKAIGYIKMNSSKKIHELYGDKKVWQRGFYDHIVRNQKDYEKICEYIYQNPFRWCYDKRSGDDY